MPKKIGCKSNEVRLENRCFPIGKERYGATIQKAQIKNGFLIVEGKNNVDQKFVEYHKNDKLKGMILKIPKNNFWYVLKGTVMQFEKQKSGYEMPVGSKDKKVALKKLKKSLKIK